MTIATIIPTPALWRTHPREAAGLGVLGFAAAAAIAGAAYSTPSLPGIGPSSAAEPALPAPPPLLVRKLASEDALSINQTIPLISGPNPAARPFALAGADAASRARALECLTSAVYYEAGNESADGQRAVAQVVLNRVRHAAFPASVCGVVYQGSTRVTGCQFTFTCDGSLARAPMASRWRHARQIAEAALAGAVFAPVGNATHYHANYVVPYWASSLAKNAVVGAHIFYRWAGGWGRPAAFVKRYAGVEPNSAALKAAALAAQAAEALAASTAPATAEEVVEAIPGAELKPEDGRVGIRFNLAARKAVEDAPKRAYVDKFEASDNLRWSLSQDIVKADELPLGKRQRDPVIEVPAGGAAGAALNK